MSFQVTPFGKTREGQSVELYTFRNTRGVMAKVMTYGALLTELHLADKRGRFANVVLGFDNLAQYEAGHPYFGATIGRFGNRIAGGRFTLDGVDYRVATNNGPNHLHGGVKGFDKVVWSAQRVGDRSVRFAYLSPDGEEGYPGNLSVSVTYTLSDHDELLLEYEATTDKPTPVNLTNHSYWNLAGAGSGSVLDQIMTLRASRYTPVDAGLIPTGELADVAGGPMDFTSPTPVGSRIQEVGGGYDHNYVIDGSPGRVRPCATLHDPKSGRLLDVETAEPGVQLYTGNFLDGSITGLGGVYQKHGALCLETQHYPDSVNRPEFPSTILRPGQTYRTSTVHRFQAL